MTGLLRDSHTVEVDDETLTELHRLGGKVVVVSRGTKVTGRLEHDGSGYVIKLDTYIEVGARKTVAIRPRIADAQGAQP